MPEFCLPRLCLLRVRGRKSDPSDSSNVVHTQTLYGFYVCCTIQSSIWWRAIHRNLQVLSVHGCTASLPSTLHDPDESKTAQTHHQHVFCDDRPSVANTPAVDSADLVTCAFVGAAGFAVVALPSRPDLYLTRSEGKTRKQAPPIS